MSSFWYIVVPLIVFGAIFYGYSSGGFLGGRIQGWVDPLIKFGSKILNFIFGI